MTNLDHQAIARELVAQMRARDGLAPVDLERFWADQEIATQDPFGAHIPQVPCGVLMAPDCVFDELGIPETPDNWHRLGHDRGWSREVFHAYNDRAEKIVGRRLLDETPWEPARTYPAPRELHDLFEARNVWHNQSYWLEAAAANEAELTALLDRVEKRLDNLREFLFPENWEREKARLQTLGIQPPAYRFQRGPVTLAASVYGAENLLLLLGDNPALAARFRDLILRAILERARLLDEDAGRTPATAAHGWQFNDDNCCLLSPALYEFFGFPILQAVFARYCPAPADRRYQHSDSNMAHLLPLLGRLDFTGVNFGPTLSVREIRAHLPRAVIDGQLAPFTFSRNQEEQIVGEFLRDFDQARETRGLRFATAGSINNGSRLTGLRLIMAAIQRHGRYD